MDYKIAHHLGEADHPAEFQQAQAKIIAANKRMLPKLDRAGQRAQHPKAHATIDALFTVRPFPEQYQDLQLGIFKEPERTFQAQIRFSNSKSFIDNPKAGDAHGMAIKLFGVPGDRLEPDPVRHTDEGSCDFILLDNETFFDGNLASYTKLNHISGDFFSLKRNGYPKIKGAISAIKALLMTKFSDPSLGKAITGTSDQFTNSLLLSNYFSTTPYMLGPNCAVKYQVRPTLAADASNTWAPELVHQNSLNMALRDSLLFSDHKFIFSAQIKRPGQDQFRIEHPEETWNGAEVIDLADIVIPKFSKISDVDWQKMRFGREADSYNIWNVPAEHRPLGILNRLRRVVYKELYRTRTDLDLDVYKK